ncbi:hypothetical protein TNCV_3777311 [Trichonephila clavipes]|nr:hypothetical protein TNCV_3777311 [Trichonephila clavipes]
MSKQMVRRWCRQFSEGRQSVHDEDCSLTARRTAAVLTEFGWELFDQPPTALILLRYKRNLAHKLFIRMPDITIRPKNLKRSKIGKKLLKLWMHGKDFWRRPWLTLGCRAIEEGEDITI